MDEPMMKRVFYGLLCTSLLVVREKRGSFSNPALQNRARLRVIYCPLRCDYGPPTYHVVKNMAMPL